MMVVGVLITLSSCNEDFLEKKPLDKFSEVDVWNDYNLANSFILNIYNEVFREMMYKSYLDIWTDNCVLNSSNNVNLEAIDEFYDAGWGRYSLIRKCNLAIEKAGASEGLSEAEKGLIVANGKFLRGMVNYNLAFRFGGIMIIDKVLTPEDDMRIPRSSIKETYDFIINDFEDAYTGLPESAETGMLTKGAAQAMISRVGLQAAAYTGDASYYDKVISASKIVEDMGYTLTSDFYKMFNDYDFALDESEIILGIFLHEDNTKFGGTMMQTLVPSNHNKALTGTPLFVESFSGWANKWASADLADAYLVVDEADGKAKHWSETSYYQDFQQNGGYVSKAIYFNRDNRFDATVVRDSTMYFVNLVTTRLGGNLNWFGFKNQYQWSMSLSGYWIRKSVYEGKKVWNTTNTSHHLPIIRYGEVLLNHAEALIRKGIAQEATALINQTRTAHGSLPELDGVGINELLDIYKNERRVDLAYENDRYWSLLRWGKAEGKDIVEELNSPVHGIEISEDGKSFSSFEIDRNNNEKRKFTTKRYLFPVPETERQLHGNLDQNPGW